VTKAQSQEQSGYPAEEVSCVAEVWIEGGQIHDAVDEVLQEQACCNRYELALSYSVLVNEYVPKISPNESIYSAAAPDHYAEGVLKGIAKSSDRHSYLKHDASQERSLPDLKDRPVQK
jgi:hypothetical protein